MVLLPAETDGESAVFLQGADGRVQVDRSRVDLLAFVKATPNDNVEGLDALVEAARQVVTKNPGKALYIGAHALPGDGPIEHAIVVAAIDQTVYNSLASLAATKKINIDNMDSYSRNAYPMLASQVTLPRNTKDAAFLLGTRISAENRVRRYLSRDSYDRESVVRGLEIVAQKIVASSETKSNVLIGFAPIDYTRSRLEGVPALYVKVYQPKPAGH